MTLLVEEEEVDDGGGDTLNSSSHISLEEQLARTARFGGLAMQNDPSPPGDDSILAAEVT